MEESLQVVARTKVSNQLKSNWYLAEGEDVYDFILWQYIDTIRTSDDIISWAIDSKYASSVSSAQRLKLKAIDMMKEDMWLKAKKWVNINIGKITSIPWNKLSI